MILADPALRWDTLPTIWLQGLSLSIQPNSFSFRCYVRRNASTDIYKSVVNGVWSAGSDTQSFVV